jgi:hypothetical protein
MVAAFKGYVSLLPAYQRRKIASIDNPQGAILMKATQQQVWLVTGKRIYRRQRAEL